MRVMKQVMAHTDAMISKAHSDCICECCKALIRCRYRLFVSLDDCDEDRLLWSGETKLGDSGEMIACKVSLSCSSFSDSDRDLSWLSINPSRESSRFVSSVVLFIVVEMIRVLQRKLPGRTELKVRLVPQL